MLIRMHLSTLLYYTKDVDSNFYYAQSRYGGWRNKHMHFNFRAKRRMHAWME